ncbi:MAG: MBL fold metallo-hydrolase [Bacteroidetes bacterium]|nr:MBL fold metallo-hydrolase [Bacteroidota bacterium]
MSLYITSLNSGSNGNCYYIGNEHEAVLIDAGISCRETERRMRRLGLPMQKIRAIFITHEHTDHTRGTEYISRKYHLPVFITAKTHRHSRMKLDPALVNSFSSDTPVHFGGLSVNAFPKRHDATEPHSFTVSGDGITVGIFTDIGTACEHVIHNLSRCHAAFLESNYDEMMLETGSYPVYLKRRIRGDDGHLSNMQALELFTTYRPPFMSLLVLSHLSAQNNHPEIVYDLFSKNANGTRIVVASRYEETEVFCIEENNVISQKHQPRGNNKGRATNLPSPTSGNGSGQVSLFLE